MGNDRSGAEPGVTVLINRTGLGGSFYWLKMSASMRDKNAITPRLLFPREIHLRETLLFFFDIARINRVHSCPSPPPPLSIHFPSNNILHEKNARSCFVYSFVANLSESRVTSFDSLNIQTRIHPSSRENFLESWLNQSMLLSNLKAPGREFK